MLIFFSKLILHEEITKLKKKRSNFFEFKFLLHNNFSTKILSYFKPKPMQ